MNFTLSSYQFSPTIQHNIIPEDEPNNLEQQHHEHFHENSHELHHKTEEKEYQYVKFEKLLSPSSSNSLDEDKQEPKSEDFGLGIVHEEGKIDGRYSLKVIETKESKYSNDSPKAVEYRESLEKTNQHLNILSEPPSPSKLASGRKKTILEEVEIEEDCRIYKGRVWPKTKLMLLENRLAFFEFTFGIKDISKIKILPSAIRSKKSENIIKIQAGEDVQLFSVTIDKKTYSVPTSFCIFAKVIEKKVAEAQIPINEEWQKSEHIESKVTEDSFIYGNIFKKSQILGNWESRFIVIKTDGVYSYIDNNTSKAHTFEIPSETVKYIWTRFNFHEGFLIVKVKHGISKTEFAIPVTCFCIREARNWLYSFYRILPQTI